uniref:Adiponectin receptor 1 n=1 Tax=Microcebus murinus TaxID=30608 RepID=A0A8C5UUU3_MICMU
MSSHKGSVVAQGNGAPAGNRETDTVELAELGPLLEEKGRRVIANPTKAEEEQTCPVPQEEEEEVRVLTLPLQAHHAMEKMEEFVYKVQHSKIPPPITLQDPFSKRGGVHHKHMMFFKKFSFKLWDGTEWPEFVLFLFLGILTMLRPNMYFMAPLQEKVVLGCSLGAVLCLKKVSRTFSNFVPWLYYSFYCSPQPRLIYLSIVCVLGISAIIVAQWDRFATPKHRQTRAGVFLGLGLSGVVPTMHFTIAEGFVKATTVGQMGWFFLMAVMYITGAGLYAARIPERFFPGKFDIWFQSHQIFHVLVVAAAFVHFYGVSNLQEFRYGLEGGCTDDSLL